MSQHRINLFGATFGRLTITRLVGFAKGTTWWEARCECGRTTMASTQSLRRSRNPVKSCGCGVVIALRRRGRVTPWGTMFHTALYMQWKRIRDRDEHTLVPEWRERFAVVADWALAYGWRPGLRIMRCDAGEPYGPENCLLVATRRRRCAPDDQRLAA